MSESYKLGFINVYGFRQSGLSGSIGSYNGVYFIKPENISRLSVYNGDSRPYNSNSRYMNSTIHFKTGGYLDVKESIQELFEKINKCNVDLDANLKNQIEESKDYKTEKESTGKVGGRGGRRRKSGSYNFGF